MRKAIDMVNGLTGLLGWPKIVPLRPLPAQNWAEQRPTYREARPAVINAALRRSQRLPSGNWYVFAASRDVGQSRPHGTTVGGVEIVAWRDEQGTLQVGPGACPHLGAPLATARVDGDGLICRWHGLRLDAECRNGWRPFPCYDDGVLAWVRLDELGGEEPTERPIRIARPRDTTLHAVARTVGVCDPADIIANRLDPWHGSWFHPYSFVGLEVIAAPPTGDIDHDSDRFLLSVAFRVTRRLGVPVEAEFTCTDPRTIVMRIRAGEGAGSLVETHATPLGPGVDGRPRTAVIEAVVAHSDRPGFGMARRAAPLLRPLMRRAALRLWRDDLAYAERRHQLRTRPLAPAHIRERRGSGAN